MACSLLLFADGPGAALRAQLGSTAPILYARMLSDTLEVASQLPGAQITVCYPSDLTPSILEAIPNATPVVRLKATGAAAVAEALDAGLAVGKPTIILRGDLPHLPLWRLRDTVTHLKTGASLVVGPADNGGWYLLGVGPKGVPLTSAVLAPDAALGSLLSAASGHVTHILPPWFGIRTVADLAALAETLRTMPPLVAPATRALFEGGQTSRAVGG